MNSLSDKTSETRNPSATRNPSETAKEKAQDFVQTWGVRLAKFSAIVAGIFGALLIIGGLVLMIMYWHYSEVEAMVEQDLGVANNQQTIVFSYTWQNQIHRHTIQDESYRKVGDKFTVYINTKNPEEYSLSGMSRWGYVGIIGFGVLIIVLGIASVWLAKKTGGITGWLGMDFGILG